MGGLFPGRFFETHKGVGMGTYVPDTMKGKDNDGWGGAIETPPSHAGLSGVIGTFSFLRRFRCCLIIICAHACHSIGHSIDLRAHQAQSRSHTRTTSTAVPWSSAFNMRMWTLLKNQFAVNIIISRDHSSAHNRVVVDAQGACVRASSRVESISTGGPTPSTRSIMNPPIPATGWPRIHYSLTARDRANMMHSAGVMLRMMKETGASLVMPIYDSFRTWRRGRDEEELDGYIKVRCVGRVRARAICGWGKERAYFI